MAIIIGVLKEELGNSLHMLKRYQKELSVLPKGSLVRKKIKGKEYDYLALRENGKFRLKYMGQLSAQKKAIYRDAKEKRQKYGKLIAELKKQIVFLKRALHERKRHSV